MVIYIPIDALFKFVLLNFAGIMIIPNFKIYHLIDIVELQINNTEYKPSY